MPYNESDTRAKLIDPAILHSGWTKDLVHREVTSGRIEIYGGRGVRGNQSTFDYVLRVQVNISTQPVALALIEAKKESLPPGHGLDQAKDYAATCKRFNIRFVFSTNGHQFVEYDSFTGLTSDPRPMDEFPTPSDLRERYERGMGFSLSSPAARPLLQQYPGGESKRRYYQDAAIRAVMEKIAQCDQRGEPTRALLSLATGAGKTFIAVNLLKRLADAGQLTRALFVCDRDELRTQALQAFQDAFGADAAEVQRGPGDANTAKNARIHIATYQTLGVENDDGDACFLTRHYPENHFTHVVIDECHRSAWGRWSQVLTRNARAVHVGLTATPRRFKTKEESDEARQDEEITANNLRYFGEPVYEYSMAQAIEDGYLAPFEIQKSLVNLDDTGIKREQIIARMPVDDRTGKPVTEDEINELYERTQFEDRIMLPDRVLAMCDDLFRYFLQTGGPEQKTIIFCARDRHADEVVATLNNLYARWCADNAQQRMEFYAFKCTAASSGNDQLPDLRASTRSHFIAATVDLLTTGVDVPCIRNIVFFRYLKSPISFYQMVGRGTRIDEKSGKLMFRIYDYTNATRLFVEEFASRPREPHERKEGQGEPADPPVIIRVGGFEARVTPQGRYVVADENGVITPIPVDEYKARLRERLMQEVSTLEDFRNHWIAPALRRDLLDALVHAGYSPSLVRMLDDREDYDLFDVLAELGWGMRPRTRHDRVQAFDFKNNSWLRGLPGRTSAVLRAIAGQFEAGGTEGLEIRDIFGTPAVKRAGGVIALWEAGEPNELVQETKRRIFSA